MGLKRQTLWSMLPLLVVTVVNIVSVPLFYRYLGPDMYALWLYVLTFSGAFGFMDLGLGVAVGRYVGVALGKGDSTAVREYWGTGNVIVIPLLALMALVFVAIGVWFGVQWFNVSPENVALLRWSFAAGGLTLFLAYYSQFWLILSQAHLDFRFLGILRTIVSLIQVVPSIYLAWLTRNPFVLILWSAGIGAVQLLVFVWHARRTYRLGFELGSSRRERVREMSAYTGKTFVAMILNSLLGSIDRIMLGKIAPPAAFVHYSICATAGGRIQGLSQAAMGPVFANTSRAVGSDGGNSAANVFDQMFAFLLPWYTLVCVWVAVWHPTLLRLWLGDELAGHVAPLFAPIVIGCCLTAIANISGAQLGPLDRLGMQLVFTIFSGLLLAAGVYVGWQMAGMVGVAWGFLASRAANIAQDFYVMRLTGAAGWLAGSTWRTLLGQVLVGVAFCAAMPTGSQAKIWQPVLGALHLVLVSGWLAREPLKRLLASISATAHPREA